MFANLDGEERTVDAELVKETHLALDTEPVTVMELVLATKDGLTLVFKRSVIVPVCFQSSVSDCELFLPPLWLASCQNVSPLFSLP